MATNMLSSMSLKTSPDVTQSSTSNENYVMVDIGANLTNKKFARDLDGVVSRALDSGVQKMMVTGVTIQGSKDALRLTHLFPGTLYCTAGVHPHEAKTWDDQTESQLRDLATNHEVVAIGECGLDFNRNFSPQDEQIHAFERQVSLAVELQKPLFVHERDAHLQLLQVLRKYVGKLPPIVIHCFTGNSVQAEAYLAMGCYIGLTGYVWKDKTDDGVRKLLQEGLLPLGRLLVETDSPYMYPNTRAAKLPQNVKENLSDRSMSFLNRYCSFHRNEPCSLPATVELIASLMGKTSEQVALQTTFNAFKVFGLST